jgi:hypothetical protein
VNKFVGGWGAALPDNGLATCDTALETAARGIAQTSTTFLAIHHAPVSIVIYDDRGLAAVACHSRCSSSSVAKPKAPGLWPEKTKTRLLAQIATEQPDLMSTNSNCQLASEMKICLIFAPPARILFPGKLRAVGPNRRGGTVGLKHLKPGASTGEKSYMAQHLCASPRQFFLLFFACLCVAEPVMAVPAIWTGASTTFTKAGSADPTQPGNQDRLTNNVWLTRGSDEGMFNIATGQETKYTRFTSPSDTKWATGAMGANTGKIITATNWQNLTFSDWAPAYGGPGSGLSAHITTEVAVVHLLTDDIYLNLLFSDFTSGGDFTYRRATPSSGDYNGNHAVDAADYVAWRKTLTQTAALFDSADGNASGTIDAGDYLFWQQHFSNLAGGGAGDSLTQTTGVPEPTTAVFLLIGLLALSRRLSRSG